MRVENNRGNCKSYRYRCGKAASALLQGRGRPCHIKFGCFPIPENCRKDHQPSISSVLHTAKDRAKRAHSGVHTLRRGFRYGSSTGWRSSRDLDLTGPFFDLSREVSFFKSASSIRLTSSEVYTSPRSERITVLIRFRYVEFRGIRENFRKTSPPPKLQNSQKRKQ